MIDLHAHIIPGADDGSESLEESLAMLEAASKDGITAIVATPHVFCPAAGTRTIRQLPELFREFKNNVQQHHIDIEILPGAEVFFASDLREQLQAWRDILCINRSRYFLLEYPADIVFPGSHEFIVYLVSEGIIPIISHPERNRVFQANPHLLYRLLQAGALAQLNAGSLQGNFGPTARAAALVFLKNNLAHVIASDCHGTGSRGPGLSFVYDLLPRLCGMDKEKIDMLVEKIPLAIVNNNLPPDIGPLDDPEEQSSNRPGFFRRLFK